MAALAPSRAFTVSRRRQLTRDSARSRRDLGRDPNRNAANSSRGLHRNSLGHGARRRAGGHRRPPLGALWESAEPAAVLLALPVDPLRNTLLAARAAGALVRRDCAIRRLLSKWRFVVNPSRRYRGEWRVNPAWMLKNRGDRVLDSPAGVALRGRRRSPECAHAAHELLCCRGCSGRSVLRYGARATSRQVQTSQVRHRLQHRPSSQR